MSKSKIYKSLLSFVTVIFTSLYLVACGGGGGGGNGDNSGEANVNANGIWDGTITDENGQDDNLRALFYNGRIIAISTTSNNVFDGDYSLNNNQLSGTTSVFQINSGILGNSNLSATVVEQSSINGSYTGDVNIGSGSFSLSFNEIYNRDSSLSLVADTYVAEGEPSNPTISVNNDGSFFGQDTDGCVYSGDIGILDSSQNLYGVTLLVESCGDFDGTYDGFSALLDDVSTNDTLSFAVSNDNFLILLPFTRQ